MASSAKSRSAKRLAKRLLQYLQHPTNMNDTKFAKVYNAIEINDEGFEQFRMQSDQFAAVYPLLKVANNHTYKKRRLMGVLNCCAKSSVSTNLLAKEKRVWGFLARLFEDDFGKITLPGCLERCSCCKQKVPVIGHRAQRCNIWLCKLITRLSPWVNKRAWKFAVEECGFLNGLLAEMQKKPYTCNSLETLLIISRVLMQQTTQRRSIDTLVRGGLFIHLEQLIPKSGNLLKDTPPCPKCSFLIDKDLNTHFNFFAKCLLEV